MEYPRPALKRAEPLSVHEARRKQRLRRIAAGDWDAPTEPPVLPPTETARDADYRARR